MSLDAYLFMSHEDGLPHCEIRHVEGVGSLAARDVLGREYLEQLLNDAGEETVAVIGNTAFRLSEAELSEILPEMSIVCPVHQVADPSESRFDDTDSYFAVPTVHSLI